MTVTDRSSWAMTATPENNVFGLQMNICLISESTMRGHAPELFFYDPQLDDDRDLELGWEMATGERYEALVGAAEALRQRWYAWHEENGRRVP